MPKYQHKNDNSSFKIFQMHRTKRSLDSKYSFTHAGKSDSMSMTLKASYSKNLQLPSRG